MALGWKSVVPLGGLLFLQVSGGGMWLLWLGLSVESKILQPPVVFVPSCLLVAALVAFTSFLPGYQIPCGSLIFKTVHSALGVGMGWVLGFLCLRL